MKLIKRWCSGGKERVRAQLGLYGEESVRFEEIEAKNAFKFEVAYLFVLLVGAMVYGVVGGQLHEESPITAAVKDKLFVPALAGIGVRCLALLVRRRISRFGFSPHLLAAVCFLADVGFLTWFEPGDDGTFWMPNQSLDDKGILSEKAFDSSAINITAGDVGTMINALEKTCITLIQTHKNHMLANERASSEVRYDAAMVYYSLHVLFWYMTGFVLLFRHALVTLPIAVAIHYSGSCGSWRTHRCEERNWLEVVFFVFTTIILISAKGYFEQLQRRMFALLQSRGREVINEKVLRFQAEFELEFDSRGYPAQQHDKHETESGSFISSSIGEPLNGHRPYARSLFSAPAALVSNTVGGCATKKSGECLPPGAVVWVEGKNVPQVVEEVTVGQRVLCHDHIGQAPKYVEVVEVESLHGKRPWVDIHLSDGTVVTVTAQHPFLPLDKNSPVPDARGSIAAASLVAGQSLMTFKMVPVPIAKVCPLDSSEEAQRGVEDRRIAISVTQPSRFEIFVTTENKRGANAVAVGSAVLPTATDLLSETSGYMINRTFIDVHHRNTQTRRASSEPCSFRYSCRNDALLVGKTRVDRARRKMSRMSAWSDSDITENSSSLHDSLMSMEDCKVLVATSPDDKVASLRQFLQVDASRIPSIGSVGHAAGKCRPCRYVGKECFKGKLCDHCHEQHPKKPRMAGNARRALKQQRSELGMDYHPAIQI